MALNAVGRQTLAVGDGSSDRRVDNVVHRVSEPDDRSKVPPPRRTKATTVPSGSDVRASGTASSAAGRMAPRQDFPASVVLARGE
jgi:hypothetical protein